MRVSDLLYSSSSSEYCDIFRMNPKISRKGKPCSVVVLQTKSSTLAIKSLVVDSAASESD